MALNIKDAETEILAREIAKRTGESIMGAIRIALKERLQRLAGSNRTPIKREKLYEILQRVDAGPGVNLHHYRPPSAIGKFDR